jgi:hypothetical protein
MVEKHLGDALRAARTDDEVRSLLAKIPDLLARTADPMFWRLTQAAALRDVAAAGGGAQRFFIETAEDRGEATADSPVCGTCRAIAQTARDAGGFSVTGTLRMLSAFDKAIAGGDDIEDLLPDILSEDEAESASARELRRRENTLPPYHPGGCRCRIVLG